MNEEEERCDFDSDLNVVWEYPCRDFLMREEGSVDHVSRASWLACDQCSTLIEANDYDGLVDWVLSQYYASHSAKPPTNKMRNVLGSMMISLYDEFRTHRLGERKAWPP